MMTTDAEIERRAREVQDMVDQVWRILSDLVIDAKTLAVARVNDSLTLEQLSRVPEAAPERRR
jgi:hypothetical protein